MVEKNQEFGDKILNFPRYIYWPAKNIAALDCSLSDHANKKQNKSNKIYYERGWHKFKLHWIINLVIFAARYIFIFYQKLNMKSPMFVITVVRYLSIRSNPLVFIVDNNREHVT